MDFMEMEISKHINIQDPWILMVLHPYTPCHCVVELCGVDAQEPELVQGILIDLVFSKR